MKLQKSFLRIVILSGLFVASVGLFQWPSSRSKTFDEQSIRQFNIDIGPGLEILNLRFQTNAAGAPTAILWDYDFTLLQNKPCSTATAPSCVISFSVYTLNSATGAAVGTTSTVSILTLPPASPPGPTIGISTPYTAPTAIGWYTIYVQVNVNDASGVMMKGMLTGIAKWIGPDGPINVRTTP